MDGINAAAPPQTVAARVPAPSGAPHSSAVERAGDYLMHMRNTCGLMNYLDGERFASGEAALLHFGRAVTAPEVTPLLPPAMSQRLTGISNAQEGGTRLLQQAPAIDTPFGPLTATAFVQVVGEYDKQGSVTQAHVLQTGLNLFAMTLKDETPTIVVQQVAGTAAGSSTLH